MSVQDKQADLIQLPPGSEAAHRSIAQKAAKILGGYAEGNGMKAEQIRLYREETAIHRIPAYISIKLTTDVLKSIVRDRAPQGLAVASGAEVTAIAEGSTRDLLKGLDVQQEILEGLKKDQGHGFGMKLLAIPLPALKKQFSAINTCLKCHGATFVSCVRCNATGNMPCTMCSGQGFSYCQWCHGVGRVNDSRGTYAACLHCQSTGRLPCLTCQGHKHLVCTFCRGQGKAGCTTCGQSGFTTEVFQVDYKAQCTFDVDWREVPSEIRDIALKLGMRELATENHAEILWQPLVVRPDDIFITCIAFLPVAKVKFLASEGRIYPGLVAGLQGRILEIEPVLDAVVKPGISALMRLSRGRMARQALIDTACKYRLVRQALAGVAHRSKRAVYQTLIKDYPLVLSDKYARATIKYAHSAMLSISTGPRYRGLAAGTVLAALPAVVYYMMHLRLLLLGALEQQYLQKYVIIPDIIVWALGWGAAVYTIRFVTASALKRMLPQTVPMDTGGLPSSGRQGIAAGLTSGIVWFAVAACAAEKPAWAIHILKLTGL